MSRLNPDGTTPNICPECGVDHEWAMADLSHGIIRLIEHDRELRPWSEFPISGDNIARQRSGLGSPSLLGSMHWDEEDGD